MADRCSDGFTPAATNDGTETRRRSSSSRKTSDMAVRAAATAAARVTSAPVVGSDSAPSDFDAACSQAGVAGLELDLAAASSSVSKPVRPVARLSGPGAVALRFRMVLRETVLNDGIFVSVIIAVSRFNSY